MYRSTKLLFALLLINAHHTSLSNTEQAVTKKDLATLATKAEIQKLINPVKRSTWFALGSLAGAATTCAWFKHQEEINQTLDLQIKTLKTHLKKLLNFLEKQIRPEEE